MPRSRNHVLRVCGSLSLVWLAAFAPAADDAPVISDRELLVRDWDLNGDGTIDDGEAEVARSKMRRERSELKAKAFGGRSEARPSSVERGNPATSGAGLTPPLVRDADPRRTDRPVEANGRDRGVKPDARPAPRRDLNAAVRPAAGRFAPDAQDRRAGSGGLGGGSGPAIVTGGARAGGFARPGYGSNVPRSDLNAGRLIPPPVVGPRPPVSGGLIPAPRRPPASPFVPPRVTAQDVPY